MSVWWIVVVCSVRVLYWDGVLLSCLCVWEIVRRLCVVVCCFDDGALCVLDVADVLAFGDACHGFVEGYVVDGALWFVDDAGAIVGDVEGVDGAAAADDDL